MTVPELKIDVDDHIFYKRNQFKSRLPKKIVYTKAHQWVFEDKDLIYFGLTKFSHRMLGKIVEVEIEKKVDDTITIGEICGWMEGFKAVSDIYSPISGNIKVINTNLYTSVESISKSPYNAGWLVGVEGEMEPDFLSVEEYASYLDQTIDQMLAEGYYESQ